jgi:PPM family protein phosphatase
LKEGDGMRYAVKSDKGMIREKNEDSYNIIDNYNGSLIIFIIADGMGGHNSGELASKMAVDTASKYIRNTPEMMNSRENIPRAIKKIIDDTNSNVFANSKKNIENTGMGTTFIITVIFNKRLYIGHVGDSRVYLIRNNEIIRVTTDHSYVEELVKIGSLTREEAESHPRKNIITKALGCEQTLEADIYSCDCKKDDCLILCTDGLTNMLGEQEIKEAVLNSKTPEDACNILIKRANKNGGRDNITVIVIKDE